MSFFVNTYGSELAEVISVTVDRWDGKEAAERIELHVGRDLQFIRINGTIVGALAGARHPRPLPGRRLRPSLGSERAGSAPPEAAGGQYGQSGCTLRRPE